MIKKGVIEKGVTPPDVIYTDDTKIAEFKAEMLEKMKKDSFVLEDNMAKRAADVVENKLK